MGFLSILGAFGVGAGVLFWSVSTGIVDHGFGSVLAVAFVIAAVIYPFYSSYQNMKSGTQAPKVMGDAQDDAAIEKALKALTEAANALEAKKKQ